MMRVLLLLMVALGNTSYCNAFVVHPHAATPATNTIAAQAKSSALFMADEAKNNVKEYKSALSKIRTNGTNGGTGSTKPMDVVMKFGGSSLANYERIDHVANLIKDQIKAGYRPRAVVCSAMGKTTNNLLNAGNNALGECVIMWTNVV